MLARIDEVADVQAAPGEAIDRLDARTTVLETATTAINHETVGMAKRMPISKRGRRRHRHCH